MFQIFCKELYTLSMTTFEHIVAELKEASSASWQTFKKSATIIYALFLLVGIISTLMAKDLTFGEVLLALVIVAVYCLIQAIFVATVVTIMSLLGHFAGWAVLLPVVLSALSVLTTFWLASTPLAGAWQEVINAIIKEGSNLKSLPIARVGHPLVLLVIIPFILIQFLGSYAVWSSVLSYVVLVIALTLVGLVIGLTVATPPTLLCIYSRLKERARLREERAQCI